MPAWILTILLVAQQSTPELLTEGWRPSVSPDGRWLAFHRSVEAPDEFGLRGEQVYRTEIWFRDLKSGDERRADEDSWLSGWIDASTIVLYDGKTAAASGSPTEAVKPPQEPSPSNRTWASGGKRLVFLPHEPWRGKPDRKPLVVEGTAKPAAIDLGHDLMAEDPGILAWSPDGRRLMFHQVFFRYGNLPLRRIGVIDVAAGTHRFVAEGDRSGSRGFWECERRGDTPGTWDAKGERFVFITGRGGNEADVFISNAAGTEVLKVTDDEECKWAAALDPAGRRIAFCAGRVEKTPDDEDGYRTRLAKCRIRVVDLYTGTETLIVVKKGVVPSTLAWLHDGSGLLIDTGWISLAKLPTPGPLEPGARIVRKPELGPRERILRALQSSNEEIVEWGAERAEEDHLPVLRAALKRCTKEGLTAAERKLLFAVDRLGARSAAPEVVASIESSYDANRIQALALVSKWGLKEATDAVLRLVEASPATDVNVHAAGTLAWLSHPTGWIVLKQYLDSNDKSLRGSVAYSLSGLAHSQAVGILIRLVEDDAVLYTSYQGEYRVGDEAERALARITGMTFNRNAVEWNDWWTKQEGRLPVVPNPNPALRKLDEVLERREKEHQEKMRR